MNTGIMTHHVQHIAHIGDQSASDELIYHITHDLRAPLRALTLLPDWIEEDFCAGGKSMPDQIGEHLDTIREQTRNLDQMLLDLRDFSRIGRKADVPSAIDLERLIGEIIVELGPDSRCDLDLQLSVGALHAPDNELRLLMKCLLKNSIQHHDQEIAEICVESSVIGANVQIRVTDDGPGIPAEHRERAFRLMTTLYRREEGAGTGVGLAIVKRIVESLGGEIGIVDNPEGRGTRIEIGIPATRVLPAGDQPRISVVR